METVSRQTAPVLEKMYQFVLWLVPTVDKFPRAQKFLLGDRMQSAPHQLTKPLTQDAVMKTINSALLFIFALTISAGANAAGSMLRVTCEGDDVGAEVLVNGKFRGECPIDFKVTAGTLKLRVQKKIDAFSERVFEQEFRMADDSVKKVEAVLGIQLTAEGVKSEQKLAAERQRLEQDAERLRLAKEAQLLADLKEQGIEPGNGKPFRDCPDCPEMVAIPPGSFEMGSTEEQPVHRVTIARAFAMGKTEVTQGQWKAIMGNNPSRFSNCGDTCPVEQVSWNDAQEFIQKFNTKTGKQYRLPTEAEWEYACRAGGRQEYCGGNDVNAVAWSAGNSISQTHPAGQKQANGYGLYDMSGNVWEWVEDSYHDSYNGAPVDGSVWQGNGAKRVLRGGSWLDLPRSARAAKRSRNEPAFRNLYNGGFRLARMLP